MASPMIQIQITAPVSDAHKTVLTTEAVAFLKKLSSEFEPRRKQCLALRHERQARLDRGEWPDFLPETEHIRKAEWSVASIPADLMDRRVEITGPVDRKMIINALQSPAPTCSWPTSRIPTRLPGRITWTGTSICATLSTARLLHVSPEGKNYKLNEKIATLLLLPPRAGTSTKSISSWMRQADLGRSVRFWAVLFP